MSEGIILLKRALSLAFAISITVKALINCRISLLSASLYWESTVLVIAYWKPDLLGSSRKN